MSNWYNLKPQALTHTLLAGILFYFAASPSSAQAGMLCSWLGIGCDPIAVMGRSSDDDAPAPTQIDQNNPPQVFSFTVSGKFDKWTDIAPETFVCDTREREDRSCVWQGFIPEIKRTATFYLEPFAHDRGMYKLSAFIAHNLGKDTNYSGNVGAMMPYQGKEFLISAGDISITKISQTPLVAEFRESNYKSEINYDKPPLGYLHIKFKEVLK